MNRPKFRVWDKFEKEMLDVHGINYDADGVWTKEMIDDERDGEFIHFSDIELLQSTGLFDKNGTEIYEGDIVKHDPVPNPFISNGYFEIIQARSGEWRMDNYRGGQVLAFSNHEVEVIGNKFEHPYLIRRTNLW
ncbi:YopX family protein [Mammaliicoccus sciuri]|uniref:YopX family protein n=1 Tax=Mammaliicoccus sciuri TaxID=1296 RepID=A0ABT7HVU3_MAMSC|nr:YopX family protein [Mammaliicoccus sciuri]MDL0112330.1 YopX family protein [Mammaliicoccus sciuri]MDL0116236.1 YopX family protein [Mammaliicoccus sciuri]